LFKIPFKTPFKDRRIMDGDTRTIFPLSRMDPMKEKNKKKDWGIRGEKENNKQSLLYLPLELYA
jgi:hypothetical protein